MEEVGIISANIETIFWGGVKKILDNQKKSIIHIDPSKKSVATILSEIEGTRVSWWLVDSDFPNPNKITDYGVSLAQRLITNFERVAVCAPEGDPSMERFLGLQGIRYVIHHEELNVICSS